MLIFFALLFTFGRHHYYFRFLAKIKSYVVLDEEWECREIIAYHLEQKVELLYIVNGDQNVSVHFFDFKHVIKIGTVVVLASIAFAALDNRLF